MPKGDLLLFMIVATITLAYAEYQTRIVATRRWVILAALWMILAWLLMWLAIGNTEPA